MTEDIIPTTDRATVNATSTVEERRAEEQRATAVIKAHHKEFMRRGFPTKEIQIGIPQLTAVGVITMCRSQKDCDFIANAVRY